MAPATPAAQLQRRIESKVRRYINDNALWPANGGLLVAVSGGPDSTALLLILSRLGAKRGVELAVAYFDHALRGKAAARAERSAVEAIARSRGAPLFTGSADVRALAKEGKLSLEEAARQARYELLASAAKESGSGAVATGHTASDQAETVLMHVLRGAGLQGLGGMAPRAPWPFPGHEDLTLIRPLLALSREETAAYCAAAGVRPVEDPTNRSLAFLRNRIRHELVPELQRFNPRVEAALGRLADAAREDVEYLEAAASSAVALDGRGSTLGRQLLGSMAPALRGRAIRRAVQSVAGDLRGFSKRHVRSLERLVTTGRTGDRLDLPRRLTAELRRDALALRSGESDSQALPSDPVCLPVPGEVRFGPLEIVAKGSCEAGTDDAVAVEVDAAAAGTRLVVRRRRSGDRMQPFGLNGTKKLQDLFVDAHVPRSERDSVPIFENERGVIWLGGLRIAGWAKPAPGAPTVVLSYRPAQANSEG